MKIKIEDVSLEDIGSGEEFSEIIKDLFIDRLAESAFRLYEEELKNKLNKNPGDKKLWEI